jgi:hypothetical protein
MKKGIFIYAFILITFMVGIYGQARSDELSDYLSLSMRKEVRFLIPTSGQPIYIHLVFEKRQTSQASLQYACQNKNCKLVFI